MSGEEKGGREGKGRKGDSIGTTARYLNMMRMYVTWSIPPSCTNRSSSSVADMKSNPAATRSLSRAIGNQAPESERTK
jgi:hypothetical protein